jgi:hypothetical protein
MVSFWLAVIDGGELLQHSQLYPNAIAHITETFSF